jgi:hypothetical protein
MTLRRHIARVLSWWNRQHPSRALERAIPAYREAAQRERRARQRNDARSIGRAVAAKRAALHADMRGAG